MPFATAISLTLTRYLCATRPNVSPDAPVWTGGVGSSVCAELPATDVDTDMAEWAGAAGSEAEVGARGAAAWASFAPPPPAPEKSDADRGAGGAYGVIDWGGAY